MTNKQQEKNSATEEPELTEERLEEVAGGAYNYTAAAKGAYNYAKNTFNATKATGGTKAAIKNIPASAKDGWNMGNTVALWKK